MPQADRTVVGTLQGVRVGQTVRGTRRGRNLEQRGRRRRARARGQGRGHGRPLRTLRAREPVHGELGLHLGRGQIRDGQCFIPVKIVCV